MARILFVENHARFARVVVPQFLSTHDVVVTTSLADARDFLKEDTFDVVLLDYDFDDGKGDELMRELSTHDARPKIVAVSSHEPGNAALVAAGADAVCGKMQFAQIARVLDKVLLNK